MSWLLCSFLFVILSCSVPVYSQSVCDNFGISNGSTCACPPGFGGPTCAAPACGGTIFQGAQRPLVSITGSTYGNLSSCSCPAGWTGTGCNVCQTAPACQTAFNATQSSSNLPDTSITPGETQNMTITCSTGPRVWAASEMSCQVINPTLQAIYPLSSTLNILRTLQPSLTPLPNVSAFGDTNTIYAQLWYDGVEQFYCEASTCAQQANSDGSANWSCNDLHCVCRTNTTFCGAVPVSNLTETINGLSGTLDIDCDPPSNTTGQAQCFFKQSILNSLFGSNGLSLSGCTFGECVRQSVIDNTVNSNSTSTGNAHDLSGGVIAGLAVVGAFVLAAILLFVFGYLAQRAARRSGIAKPITDKKGDVGITWQSIGYSVLSQTKTRVPWKRSQGDQKYILDRITGSVQPGKMLAILGPSGAGKSTLVDLLAGKQKDGYTYGTVRFFAADPTDPVKQPRIGFVDQADILPANLTVKEALLFAARLRLPENVPDSAKVARVFEVMEELGLSDLSEMRIGSHERRGISGGEMRRLSIGLELVAAPDILILDEPTSGLDSVSALKVATVLHELAHERNTVVIASIHQPSSKLYRMFDQVLLLSAGHQLYFGEGGIDAANYFAARGLPCQEGYNVADHLLDIASDPPSSLLDTGTETRPSFSRNPESGANASVAEKGYAPIHGYPPPNGFSHPAIEKSQIGLPAIVGMNYASTFLTQLQVLSWREWKNLKRDKTLFLTHVAIAAVLGVFCGGLYFKTGITIAGFQSRIGSLFFLGSLLAFSSLSALYNLVEIRPLFLRERAGSYYSPAAWLLTRFVFDVVPLRLIPTLIVATITYWMAGLSPDAARFFKFLFILVLYALAMTLFNLLLACLFRNGGIAILLSALFNLYIMTYAGFFVHLGDIPPVLRWLQWFSILKYCLEALSVNEVGSGLMIEDTLEGVPVNVSAQLIMQLLFGFGENNYYRDVLVLFAFIGGFAVGLLFIVFFFLRERR